MNQRLVALNQVVGTRSTASVICPARNGTRWNASLPKRCVTSLSAFGGEGRGEVVLLSLLLLFLLFISPSAPAATFTTNALITEADTSFDGQDIVVSGATLTVDGRHSINSLLLPTTSMLTI